MHRNIDPRRRRELSSARRTRRIHQRAARDPRSVVENNRVNLPARPLDTRHRALHIDNPEAPRLFAERLHQSPAVKPPLARTPPAGRCNLVRIEIRELLLQSIRLEKHNIRAFRRLERLIFLQNRPPRLGPEIKIAIFGKMQIRPIIPHRKPLADTLDKLQPEHGNPDIHGG